MIIYWFPAIKLYLRQCICCSIRILNFYKTNHVQYDLCTSTNYWEDSNKRSRGYVVIAVHTSLDVCVPNKLHQTGPCYTHITDQIQLAGDVHYKVYINKLLCKYVLIILYRLCRVYFIFGYYREGYCITLCCHQVDFHAQVLCNSSSLFESLVARNG